VDLDGRPHPRGVSAELRGTEGAQEGALMLAGGTDSADIDAGAGAVALADVAGEPLRVVEGRVLGLAARPAVHQPVLDAVPLVRPVHHPLGIADGRVVDNIVAGGDTAARESRVGPLLGRGL